MSGRKKTVKPPVRSCKYCGCTDDNGCPEGCCWVDQHVDICSTCVEAIVPALDRLYVVFEALKSRKAARR